MADRYSHKDSQRYKDDKTVRRTSPQKSRYKERQRERGYERRSRSPRSRSPRPTSRRHTSGSSGSTHRHTSHRSRSPKNDSNQRHVQESTEHSSNPVNTPPTKPSNKDVQKFGQQQQQQQQQPLLKQPLSIQEKRKLLWNKHGRNNWGSVVFNGDDSGETQSKFRRLMGIKTDTPAADNTANTTTTTTPSGLLNDLESQYESSRVLTHFARGAGLGYSLMTQTKLNNEPNNNTDEL